MIWVDILYCAVAFLLVFLNGFFVLVEFALVKVRRTRMEELNRSGQQKAALVLKMHHQMDAYLSATQLGITVSSLGLGWIGEPAFAHLFEPVISLPGIWSDVFTHSLSLGAAFIFITFLHILIGELVPKSIAIQKAEQSILTTARPMNLFYHIFYLPLIVLNSASNSVLKVIGFSPAGEIEGAVSQEELRIVLSHSQRRGEVSLDRLLLIENVLDLRDLKVTNVMVPLPNVSFLDARRPFTENLAIIREKRFSRYPLCDGRPDRILGMVHVKDLAFAALEGDKIRLDRFARKMITVTDTLPLEILLRNFQREHAHMAVVVDSHGKLKGIVTLEDVLEELTGEIIDEFEREKVWKLADYIVKDAIFLDLKADGREGVIMGLISALAHYAPAEIQIEGCFKAVWEREQMAITSLGRGIAVPHARLDSLSRPYVAFARCSETLDFKPVDGTDIHLVFLILTPTSMPMAQVKIVARIAGLSQSEFLLGRLSSAKSTDEVIEIIKVADVSATL